MSFLLDETSKLSAKCPKLCCYIGCPTDFLLSMTWNESLWITWHKGNNKKIQLVFSCWPSGSLVRKRLSYLQKNNQKPRVLTELPLLLLGCDPSLSVSVHVPPRASELSLRLKFAHLLQGSLPHQGGRVSVGAAQSVPQREVLAVVVVEEEVVVGVVGRAVDDADQRAGHPVVAVVDGDGPDVDEDVEGQVEHLVQWEEEGVDVVGEPLHEAVHRVEGVAGKGRWDLPHVVGLVEQLCGPGGQRSFIKEKLELNHLNILAAPLYLYPTSRFQDLNSIGSMWPLHLLLIIFNHLHYITVYNCLFIYVIVSILLSLPAIFMFYNVISFNASILTAIPSFTAPRPDRHCKCELVVN